MTTLNLAEIETRIKDNQIEMATLSTRYDQMVAEFKQQETEHNNNLQKHQQRYQQLVGAVAALEQLKRLLTEDAVAAPKNGEGKLKPVNRLAKKEPHQGGI